MATQTIFTNAVTILNTCISQSHHNIRISRFSVLTKMTEFDKNQHLKELQVMLNFNGYY